MGYGPAAAEPAAREEALPGADIADEAGVDEVTKLKARLYDLELRYVPSQPRDDHGRWASGGGEGGGSSAAQPASSSQPSRGVQVAFGGPAGNTMSDAGGFMLPSGTQPQTAQLRDGEADLKPQMAQFAGGDERYKVDLDKEPAKDHIVNRHIGRTDEQLKEELKLYRFRAGAFSVIRADLGTFSSRGDAEYFINETLASDRETVDRVARGELQEAFIVKRFGYATGREAHRLEDDSSTIIRPTYEVGVGIEPDSRSKKGYRLYTAYSRNAYEEK